MIHKSFLLFCFASFFATSLSHADESKFYKKVAENYILAQFRDSQSNIKIVAKASDIKTNRELNTKCLGYLTAQLQGSEIQATSHVKIICKEPDNSFTLRIPVKVQKLIPSIVASKNLSRNTVITDEDLEENYVDMNTNMQNSIIDKNILIGSRLKTNIKQGQHFKASNFCVVCKGDSIVIEAKKGGLTLKTTGTAQEDGYINETIEVKNNKSKKSIKAIVVAPALVRVLL